MNEPLTDKEIELANLAAESALAQEYEAAKQRRVRKGILYWLKQMGSIVWIALTGLSFLKYFIPSTMLISLFSTGSTVKSMVDKKKTAGLIAGIVFLGLLDLMISAGYDLVKWGVAIPGVAAATLSLAVVATTVLTIMSVVSAVDYFRSLVKHRKNPERTTPVQKFELVNKAVNTIVFLTLAVCVPPIILFPPLAVFFAPIAAVSFLTFLTVQIVGWAKKNSAWNATIKEFQKGKIKNPYDEVFTLEEKLEFNRRLLQEKEQKPVGIFQKIKDGWNSVFGSKEEKAALEEKKQETALAYIEKIYEEKFNDYPDKEKLKAAYDLLRDSDGRIKFKEASALAEADKHYADKIRKGEPVPELGFNSICAQSLLPPDYRTTSDSDFLNSLKSPVYQYGQGSFGRKPESKESPSKVQEVVSHSPRK